MAERRDATGVDVIREVVLAPVGANAHTAEPITDRSEWFEVLAEIFDLRFDTAPHEWRERLWDTIFEAHRAWEAAVRLTGGATAVEDPPLELKRRERWMRHRPTRTHLSLSVLGHADQRCPPRSVEVSPELTHIHIEICSSGGPRLDNLGCLQRSR
jgi:hypothetical protein